MFWIRGSREEQHEADDRDRQVLAVQVGARALLDGKRYRLHALIAGRKREQGSRGHEAVRNGARRANKGDDDPMVRQKAAQEKSSAV